MQDAIVYQVWKNMEIFEKEISRNKKPAVAL